MMFRSNSGSGSKGQSAIEYLMTYGWMLLVIAIVGALLFALFQDQELESQTVDGFESEDDLRVQEAAASNGTLNLQVRSYSEDNLQDVTVCFRNENFNTTCDQVSDVERVGEIVYTGEFFEPANNTYTYDVEFNYTSSSDLPGSSSGTITIAAKPTGNKTSDGSGDGSGDNNGGGDNDGSSDPVDTSAEYLRIQEVTNNASSTVEGGTVGFDFTVNNTGNSDGTQDITLSINNTQEALKQVSVNNGSTQQVTLNWNTVSGDSGPFNYSLASANDSVTGSGTLSSSSSGGGSTTVVGEDFNDGGLSNYDQYNSSVWGISSTIEGNGSLTVGLNHSSGSPKGLISYAGGNLDYYPEVGDAFSILYRPDNSGGGFIAGIPDGNTLRDQAFAAGMFIAKTPSAEQVQTVSAGFNGQGSIATGLTNGEVYELEAKWYQNAAVFDVYEYTVGEGRGSSILTQPVKLNNNGSLNSESGFAWISFANQGSPEYDKLMKVRDLSNPDKTVIDLNLSQIGSPSGTEAFNPNKGSTYSYNIETFGDFQAQIGETVDLDYTFNEPNGSSTTRSDSFVVGESEPGKINYTWQSSGNGSIQVQATYNGSSDYSISRSVTVEDTSSSTGSVALSLDTNTEWEDNQAIENFEIVEGGISQGTSSQAQYASKAVQTAYSSYERVNITGEVTQLNAGSNAHTLEVDTEGANTQHSFTMENEPGVTIEKYIDISGNGHEGALNYVLINTPGDENTYKFTKLTVEATQ